MQFHRVKVKQFRRVNGHLHLSCDHGRVYRLISLISALVVGVIEPAIRRADPSSPVPSPGQWWRGRAARLVLRTGAGVVPARPGESGERPTAAAGFAPRAGEDRPEDRPVRQELQGCVRQPHRGNTDAAMVTDCSGAGVPWPETVQLYTAGPTRLGGTSVTSPTAGRW
jgi:hypothetical protein